MLNETRKLKLYTFLRAMALETMKQYTEELKTIGERYDYPNLWAKYETRLLLEESKRLDRNHCIWGIKYYAQKSLEYKELIDKLKQNG